MSIKEIKIRIHRAAIEAARDADEISLIAVSKVQPNARVQAVLEAGHKTFGENRVQEAFGKWPDFQQTFGKLDLHLIGPLQTNKARQAVELFGTIHSVDRPKLATTLARLAQERGASPDIFIQVNTGEEPQKAGILPSETDAFVSECRALDLPVKGLMCIPPVEEEASLHFAFWPRWPNATDWRACPWECQMILKRRSNSAQRIFALDPLFSERGCQRRDNQPCFISNLLCDP
jgi:pyridoxal phosphate enzyme (YggS family)